VSTRARHRRRLRRPRRHLRRPLPMRRPPKNPSTAASTAAIKSAHHGRSGITAGPVAERASRRRPGSARERRSGRVPLPRRYPTPIRVPRSVFACVRRFRAPRWPLRSMRRWKSCKRATPPRVAPPHPGLRAMRAALGRGRSGRRRTTRRRPRGTRKQRQGRSGPSPLLGSYHSEKKAIKAKVDSESLFTGGGGKSPQEAKVLTWYLENPSPWASGPGRATVPTASASASGGPAPRGGKGGGSGRR